MRVSVIVPARNAEDNLPALLEALACQTLPAADRETIVVDDRSRDRTAAIAEQGGVRVLRTPEHRGSYAARNLGLEVAAGEVLAFTDSDCRPAPDWLAQGLAGLEDQGVDLVAGNVEMRLGPRPAISEMLSASADLNQGAFAFLGGWGATANLFVNRRVFERIGPFNGELISGGDLELGLRAREAGFEIWYCDDAVVAHPPRRGLAVPKKAFRTGFGQAQIVRKGRGPAADPGMYRTRLRSLVPRPGLPLDVERVVEAGYEPTAAEMRRLSLAAYPLGSWPRFLGYRIGRVVTRGAGPAA